MNISGKAIILQTKKYSENSAIATLFTKEYGIIKGMVRNISSKRNRGIYQISNIVEFVWSARLEEQLGSLKCELDQAIAFEYLDDPIKLIAIESICYLLELLIPQKEVNKNIFYYLYSFLNVSLKNDEWLEDLVRFEINLLSNCGFGLDLTSCAASGVTENLIYVSPKTGRAVSLEAGENYKNKLLILPQFILQKEGKAQQVNDIINGFKLTQYFFNKILTEFQYLPAARTYLLNMLI